MKISLLDFWGDLDLNNNFLTNLLRLSRENVEIVPAEQADIIICSLFGEQHKAFYGKKKIIFYTGENKRPDYQSYDYSISFDFDDYNGRNVRIPLWYFYIDWFDQNTYGNPQYLIPERYLYESNEFQQKPKIRFCSTVFSAPYLDRFQMIQLINQYKPVDGYGKVFNARISEGEKVKLDIISNYKFNVCFENTVYPGYFTEKLLHSKIAGCVPIYKSHSSVDNDFNKNCFINVDEVGPEQALQQIVDIDQNDNSYRKIIEEPLFLKKIDINDVVNKINKII